MSHLNCSKVVLAFVHKSMSQFYRKIFFLKLAVNDQSQWTLHAILIEFSIQISMSLGAAIPLNPNNTENSRK